MRKLSFVDSPRMGQNHFYFVLSKKVCIFSELIKLSTSNNPIECLIAFSETGEKAVTAVWDISNWKRIGYKRLLRKPASVMSISRDGKYLAL